MRRAPPPALPLLSAEPNLHHAVFYVQRNPRNYPKRRLAWFRRQAGLVWLQGFGDSGAVRQAAIVRTRTFLHS